MQRLLENAQKPLGHAMAQYYVAMFDGPPEAVITVLIEILGLHNMDDIQHVWRNSANDDLVQLTYMSILACVICVMEPFRSCELYIGII